MGFYIFLLFWVIGLGWVANCIIKAPYLDSEGNYVSKKDWENLNRMDKEYD